MVERFRLHVLLVWLAYAAGAAAVSLAVILPIFFLVDVLYDGGDGVTTLLIAVVLAWAVLAWVLVRRRVRF